MTGGSPYDDLVKGWEYVRDNFDFVDTDHGVAAGASYGGFMINWIQGNDLGRKFKALVSHDGSFIADAKINTEELWFAQHEVYPLRSTVEIEFSLTKYRTTAPTGTTATTTASGTPLPPNTSSNGILPCSSSTVTTIIVSLYQRAWRFSTFSRSAAFLVVF